MKIISCQLLVLCCLLFTSCNPSTPEYYFDIAVLNTNMLTGFASDGLARELESASEQLDPATGKAVPILRKEEMKQKIQFLDEGFAKLKDLKETPDTKEMLQSSIALYEYVLPVYKKDYMELANLYDQGAAKEKTESMAESIHQKYYPKFDELYKKVTNVGKQYADRHSIKVNWGG